MKIKNNQFKKDYFISLLLILTSIKSSNFISANDYFLYFVLVALSFFTLQRGFSLIDSQIIKILFFISLLLFVYIVKFLEIFEGFSLFVLMRVFIALLAIKLLNTYDLLKYTRNWIYFGAVISIPFFLVQIINPTLTFILIRFIQGIIPFSGEPIPTYANIIIWGISNQIGAEYRNCGFMWEPGAFAAFLLVALVIELTLNRFTVNKRIIVLVSVLITTQSTMGFLGLILILVLFTNQRRKQNSSSVFLVPFAAIIIFFLFNLNFVFDKIVNEIDNQEDIVAFAYRTDRDFASLGRIGSMNADIVDLFNEPIFGIGGNTDIMEGIKGKIINRTNGLTRFLLIFGIFGFVTYFYNIYMSFKKYGIINDVKNKYYAFYIILLICVLSFSNDILITPLFFSLSVLHLFDRNVQINTKKA